MHPSKLKKKAKWCYIWPHTPITALLLELLTIVDSLAMELAPPRCFSPHQTYMVHYFPWDFEGLLVILSLTFLKWTVLRANISIWKHFLTAFCFLYCAISQEAWYMKKANKYGFDPWVLIMLKSYFDRTAERAKIFLTFLVPVFVEL